MTATDAWQQWSRQVFHARADRQNEIQAEYGKPGLERVRSDVEGHWKEVMRKMHARIRDQMARGIRTAEQDLETLRHMGLGAEPDARVAREHLLPLLRKHLKIMDDWMEGISYRPGP